MGCVFYVSGQLNVRLALESGGASDSVMVRLLSVSEGVCAEEVGGGGVGLVREGKTLTFAFPLIQSQ